MKLFIWPFLEISPFFSGERVLGYLYVYLLYTVVLLVAYLSKNLYSVETTYGINSVISKLMIFVENAETGRFLFLIMLILNCFTCL
jgi:hypothetical protein